MSHEYSDASIGALYDKISEQDVKIQALEAERFRLRAENEALREQREYLNHQCLSLEENLAKARAFVVEAVEKRDALKSQLDAEKAKEMAQ